MPTPQAQILGGHHDTIQITLTADAVSGEIILLPDDRAAVVLGLDATNGLNSGDEAAVAVGGPIRIHKANAVNLSAQKRIYWDVSGDTAIASGSAATGDFDIGGRIAGGAASDLYVDVDLNSKAGTVAA